MHLPGIPRRDWAAHSRWQYLYVLRDLTSAMNVQLAVLGSEHHSEFKVWIYSHIRKVLVGALALSPRRLLALQDKDV